MSIGNILGNIPKIVHVSWKNKNVLDSSYCMIQKGIGNILKLNPDYKVIIYDDDNINEYLKIKLTEEDYFHIKDRYIVEKVDLWRLLIMYNEGGIYTDIDRYYNIPFSKFIHHNTSMVLPMYMDCDFSQDIMISAPLNPIFKCAIDLNLKRRKDGCKDIYYLGPKTYMHAIVNIFCGVSIVTNSLPRDCNNKIMEDIASNESFETFKENPHGLTTFFDSQLNNIEYTDFKHIYNKEKHELYSAYNVGKWGDYTKK